jgi:subtilase family serine protease
MLIGALGVESQRAAAQAEDPLPDLTITKVEIKPAPIVTADGRRLLARGMTYTLKVQIKNVGNGAVRGAVAVAAPYGCPGQGRTPNLLFAGNNLAPDESKYSNSFSVTLRADTGGKCVFRFIVDPDNVHPEEDESLRSNTRTLTYEVP